MKYANQSKEIKINKCQAEMNREKKNICRLSKTEKFAWQKITNELLVISYINMDSSKHLII